ncbi:MarR family transcriptional regulator [Polymorphobacter multimanifer]|uniref:MarR family winged helix-turn-helix transcriptional regulator n=1 Tax=Polymorphobacter multimanifer TaxID=1070431 RepID=UPI00166E4A08|nr:MarR family transcriptional regulator [Polymorphobacter multimanifer]GGI89802.1 MarR family transcriptional regulator [Polymorphobacter multimanifer]
MVSSTPELLTPDLLPLETVHHVRDTCLCLATQRAARRRARHFDNALRRFDLTNNQFSLLVSINRPVPPAIGQLAPFLAMSASTLTAAVKPLARRGLVMIEPDAEDRRSKRLRITPVGVALMREAVLVWRSAHADYERGLADGAADALRAALAGVEPEG